MLTNGLGEPRKPIAQVRPGTIARFGMDDDMVVLVLANFETTSYLGDGKGGTIVKPSRRLVFYGCFSEPGSWESGRLFDQAYVYPERETLTVLLEPEVHT